MQNVRHSDTEERLWINLYMSIGGFQSLEISLNSKSINSFLGKNSVMVYYLHISIILNIKWYITY